MSEVDRQFMSLILSSEEYQDVVDAAEERGTSTHELIRRAVLDDIHR